MNHRSDCDDLCNGDWCSCPCHVDLDEEDLALQAADEAQEREEQEFMGQVDQAERDPMTMTPQDREKALSQNPWFTCTRCGSRFHYRDHHWCRPEQGPPVSARSGVDRVLGAGSEAPRSASERTQPVNPDRPAGGGCLS